MAKRTIIKIDEDKCNGCGLCVNACAEGALQIVDGKAKLVSDVYCDGLGACIGDCPVGALTFEEREAEAFDEAAVEKHLVEQKQVAPAPSAPPAGGCPGAQMRSLAGKQIGGGCPGSAMRTFERKAESDDANNEVESELAQWPIQLHLVQPAAPYFLRADIVIAASCSAFACGGFHPKLLRGKSLIIACPKLDDKTGYVEKLTALFQHARPYAVTVVRMEVPCCSGLTQLVEQARPAAADAQTPVREITLSLTGDIVQERELQVTAQSA